MNVRQIPATLAILIIVCAVGVLGTYGLGHAPPFPAPQPWTCVALALAGSSLWISVRKRVTRKFELIRYLFACLLLLLATLILSEYLAGSNFGFDSILFPNVLPHITYRGRPSPGSVFNFLMIGIALLLYRSRANPLEVTCEAAAIASFTFCYLNFTTAIIRNGAIVTLDGISPLTSLLFVFCSVALLVSRTDGRVVTLLKSTGAAGIFARWLMPVPFVLPVLSRELTQLGQQFGLLTQKSNSSVVLFLNILCGLYVVWAASIQVLRLDRLRQRAEKDLRDSLEGLDRQVRLRTGELVVANQQLKDEIADRHRAELQLQLANATLTNLVDASPLAICAWNVDGSIRKCNAAAEALLKSDAALFQPVVDHAKQGDIVAGTEISRTTPAGPEYFQVWVSPLRDAVGSPSGAVLFAVDVSERKAIDAKLLQTQKLESLGVLAGGIAHDFNNLLTGIMGNASLLLETNVDNQFTVQLLEQVVMATQRAADLTGQMLAYAGKGRFVLVPVNVSKLVREIAGLIQASIGHRIEIRFELDENLPLMQVDPSQIQQVVMNLIMNAAEAIAGSGEVVISTSEQNIDSEFIRRELHASDLKPGRYVRLAVCDNGQGMTGDTMGRIFEPFFTTKFTGRGLGLAAVHGIMRSHHGGLSLTSALGEGTTFQLYFPAFQEVAMPGEKVVTPKRARSLRPRTVLLADDERLVRDAAFHSLSTLGYRVELAESGIRAIEMVRDLREDLDAIVLDLTMPGLSGRETYARLKVVAPDVPILLSSGFDESEVERNFDGAQIDMFLQKPYTAAQLAAAIDSLPIRASTAVLV